MKKLFQISFFLMLLSVGFSCREKTQIIWLDDLDLEMLSENIRPIKSRTNYLNLPIQINGTTYNRGIGVITISVISVLLNENAKTFTAVVGPDDNGNKDISVRFFVIGDQKILFESGEMKIGDAPKNIQINLKGIKQLGLLVTDDVGGVNNKRTYSNWADAHFLMYGQHVPEMLTNSEDRYIQTPPPDKKPKINSAKVFGVRPSHPFLYTIAATGDRPMQFSGKNMPLGLKIDAASGIISGKISQRGSHIVELKAENKYGEAIRELKIVVGDTIALSPPMGWNGWNSWAFDIDAEKVLASAKAMVSTGLINHGWTYINIDDTWQGIRGGEFNAVQPNEKFPEFEEMVDEVHALGLKMGIYSTPYISSYAGYVGGSSNHEEGGGNARFYYGGPSGFQKNREIQV